MTQEYMLPLTNCLTTFALRLSRLLAPNVMDFQCRSLVFPRNLLKRRSKGPEMVTTLSLTHDVFVTFRTLICSFLFATRLGLSVTALKVSVWFRRYALCVGTNTISFAPSGAGWAGLCKLGTASLQSWCPTRGARLRGGYTDLHLDLFQESGIGWSQVACSCTAPDVHSRVMFHLYGSPTKSFGYLWIIFDTLSTFSTMTLISCCKERN